jgi:hypothetical protein
MKSERFFLSCLLLFLTKRCSSLSSSRKNSGSAKRPFEKQKVAVFGTGGYLGGLCYGFLQRAGSLYGTGISGIRSPRAITATATGSASLNSILSRNFILAQADESFVKLTDMSSVATIQERVQGFDAAIMATRCTLEKRPVTPGSYEKSPNSKTVEFYMDQPRSSSIIGNDDSNFSFQMFQKAVEACREGGIKRIVTIETDGEFANDSAVGTRYLDVLRSCGVPYCYIIPSGKLENIQDYTHAKGVQSNLKIKFVNDIESAKKVPSTIIYREDLAALTCQSLLSLDWDIDAILQVECTGPLSLQSTTIPVSQEWCVNSMTLESLFF